MEDGTKDSLESLEVDNEVEKMNGEVEDARLKTNETKTAVENMVDYHLEGKG